MNVMKSWKARTAKGKSVAFLCLILFGYIAGITGKFMNEAYMAQFAESVNEFLAFRRYELLPDKGRISHAQAEKKAHAEYDIFNRTQLINSDFDKLVQRTRQS